MAQSRHELLHCTCPLSGVKRTWRFALQMFAFDPKRTSCGPLTSFIRPVTMGVLSLRPVDETPRFHHTSWRCRSCVAACGERATARADSTHRRTDGVREGQSGSAGTDRGVY